LIVAQKVLEQAEDQRQERTKALVKAMEVAVQNGIVRAFKKG
jgi:hypothetical protein